MPTYQLVQTLLAARRDISLPKALRDLDAFSSIILDDVGYRGRGGCAPHADGRALREVQPDPPIGEIGSRPRTKSALHHQLPSSARIGRLLPEMARIIVRPKASTF